MQVQGAADGVEARQDERDDFKLDQIAGLIEQQVLPLQIPFGLLSSQLGLYEVAVVENQEGGRAEEENQVERVVDGLAVLCAGKLR